MVADALLEQEIEIICTDCAERDTCKKLCLELEAQLTDPNAETTRENEYEVLTPHGNMDLFPAGTLDIPHRCWDGVWRQGGSPWPGR